jgi:bifunctional DNA-binding transcriptional regulator/antitoxin component of YhaV-PrlF toxin-antitoxin module
MTVEDNNRLPIPEPFAKRFAIEPGIVVIFVDSGRDNEFTVRVMKSSYAGALAGVFGSLEETAAYIEEERASWDALDWRIMSMSIGAVICEGQNSTIARRLLPGLP